jgi:excisionase family DNA binding protein
MADEFLTVGEVAAALRCSPRTVLRVIDEGRLPAVRVSERIRRVGRSDLREFIGKSSGGASGAAVESEAVSA